MKVLVVVDHAVGISGPHRNVVGSLNALCARDDVSVRLVTGKIDPGEPYAKGRNLEVLLGFHPHDPHRIPSNIVKLRRAARGCDVVHVPSGLKALLYAQLVRKGRRLVAGPNVTHLPIRRSDSPGWPELSLMCDVWLEASQARRNHVIRCAGKRFECKVRCIHHAIDAAKFSPERRAPETWARHGIRRESTKILYVGKDYRLKGVHQLLDAIEIVNRGRQSREIDFVLVGRMSQGTVDRAAKQRNVHVFGFRRGEELAEIYASSDISVVPSSWEGFGFTCLEAMASGVPVVGSRTGGIVEQIVDGRTGLLVDIVGPGGRHKPDAGAVLAEAITRLVADSCLRRRLGGNARRRVLEHFTEARLGVELVSVFKRC